MPRTVSLQAAGLCVLALALASWAVALVSWGVTGTLSLMALVTAAMFTALVVAWPFTHATPPPEAGAQTCRQCGGAVVAALRFCIQCGAYPKAAPRGAPPQGV